MVVQLVTDEMMAALRTVAYTGLQTPFSILRRTTVTGTGGDDDYETWVDIGATDPAQPDGILRGWLYMTNTPAIEGGLQPGMAAALNIFRFVCPVGTDIQVGDRLGMSGGIYTVEDTSIDDTYNVFLNVVLRSTTPAAGT